MRLLLLGLFLASATAVAQDWGVQPNQAVAEAKAKELLDQRLKDPYTAHYRWEPVEGTTTIYDVVSRQDYSGWLLVGYVNSKNSYGGYIGEREYKFLFAGDEMVAGFMVKQFTSGDEHWKL